MSRSLEAIQGLIEKEIGLKPNSISGVLWEYALKERMSLSGLTKEQDYFNRLLSSSHERQEFIELIVIPETWFFRDKGSFDFLSQFIKDQWFKKYQKQILKVMCLPCSTGEEAYSIAITLLECGLTKNQFWIDAVDVSKKALAKAETGIYSKNSFRGRDLSFRDRYFEKREEGYFLKSFIKDQVHFSMWNVLDDQIPFEPASYHILFCRNLLIYLDVPAQNKTFRFIEKILQPHGFLVLGPAETQVARYYGFEPYPFNKSYAFYAKKALNSYKKKMPEAILEAIQHQVREVKGKNVHHAPKHLSQNEAVDEKSGLIQEASRLADAGYFSEALDLCLNYLYRFGAHHQIYYLMGVIYHALGQEQRAEEFFHKAVYLNSTYYEALIYLALLFEKKGNKQQAELFLKRAQKVNK
jgi:chemotaxis protein methyltransferase WspC